MSTVPISDPWLRRALQEAAGSDTVTPESLAELTELDWSEYRAEAGMTWGQIKDIAPLRHCANLRVLSFDGNAVGDLGPLAACPLLEEVWLVSNNVTDVSPLRGARHLHTLNLDMNYRLSDIAPLRGLPALRSLNIAHTAVTGIEPLLDLPALQEVTLYDLPLDLSPNAADRQVLAALIRRDITIGFRGIETLLEAVRAEQSAALGDAPTLAAQLAALGARDIATLLSAGDINARDADGYTLLHLAVKPKPFSTGADPVIDRPALTRLLLAQPGLQVDARDAGGHTPLAYLTDNSYLTDIAVVQLLLEAGADPNAPCDCQMTPVEHALSCNRRDLVDLLVAHGGDAFTPRAVNEYCKKGDVARVQQALASGYDLAAREPKFAESALHAAASGGRAEVVRLLLEHGADTNARSAVENTPLHAAANAEVAQLLLDAGAEVDVRDAYQQQTPLFRAAYFGRPDVVQVLIAHGADVNARDNQGKAPLHNCLYVSAQDATLNIITALVEAGADPNALDAAGQTPLDGYRQPEMKKHLRTLGGKTGKTARK